jgi:hypothetical protein
LKTRNIFNGLKNMRIFNTSAVDDIPMTATPSVKSGNRKSVNRKAVNRNPGNKKALTVNPDVVDSVRRQSYSNKPANKEPAIENLLLEYRRLYPRK